MLIRKKKRFKQGRESVRRCKKRIEKEGFKSTNTGVEYWLPKTVHKKIRKIHDSTVVHFIRYLPDLFIYDMEKRSFILAQVKSTSSEHREGENFAIETNALEIDKKLAQVGVNIAVIFENYPFEFFGDLAEEIKPFIEIPFEKSKMTEGSGTPFSLVKKKSVPRITSFREFFMDKFYNKD